MFLELDHRIDNKTGDNCSSDKKKTTIICGFYKNFPYCYLTHINVNHQTIYNKSIKESTRRELITQTAVSTIMNHKKPPKNSLICNAFFSAVNSKTDHDKKNQSTEKF